MSRIEATFHRLKERRKTGLIAYVTVGFPSVDSSLELVPAIVEAGADIIELGVPFSDPLADGATMQRASQVALENGVTLRDCLDACRTLRQRVPLVPLTLMGYYNPILSYGLERFARDAQGAGADGVIVPDLPPEEAGPLRQACLSHGVDLIFLLAPTSTDRRIEEVSRMASGFIYCVSLTGVTGVRSELPSELPAFIQRIRRRATVPLAVGFGISTSKQVSAIGREAEAVIIGSALVEAVEHAAPDERMASAQSLIGELSRGTVGGADHG